MGRRKVGWMTAGALGFLLLFHPAREALSNPDADPALNAIASYLSREFTFQDDAALFQTADYWQEPEEFLARKRGDCEDYAILAKTLLERQGKEAFLLSLYGEQGYAHTVCVFRDEKGYSVINQDRLIRYRAPTLEALANLLCPSWTWGAVAEPAGHRGRAVSVFRRASA